MTARWLLALALSCVSSALALVAIALALVARSRTARLVHLLAARSVQVHMAFELAEALLLDLVAAKEADAKTKALLLHEVLSAPLAPGDGAHRAQ